MSNDSEKEPIFAAPPAYSGESAPIYQELTKTKRMVRQQIIRDLKLDIVSRASSL